MDNLSGTTPETGPEPPQEFLSGVQAKVQYEVRADPETVYPTGMKIEAEPDLTADLTATGDVGPAGVHSEPSPDTSSPDTSTIVGAWPQDDQHAEDAAAPRIRGVELLADESPAHFFSAADGLTSEPPPTGQVLIVTNQRVIAFCQADGKQETYLVPMNEVKHVVVKAGSRSASMLLQGSLMVIAGIFIYLVLGYWLTNQIEGPTIPVLHMDVAPFIALIIVLTGLTMIAQVYFTKPDGTVTIQGDGLQFTFPFRGDAAQREIFDVVNTTFAMRQTKLEEEPQLEIADSVSPWESRSPSP
jgi:hypothetical protein